MRRKTLSGVRARHISGQGARATDTSIWRLSEPVFPTVSVAWTLIVYVPASP